MNWFEQHVSCFLSVHHGEGHALSESHWKTRGGCNHRKSCIWGPGTPSQTSAEAEVTDNESIRKQAFKTTKQIIILRITSSTQQVFKGLFIRRILWCRMSILEMFTYAFFCHSQCLRCWMEFCLLWQPTKATLSTFHFVYLNSPWQVGSATVLTNVVLLYLFLGGWDFWKIVFYTLFLFCSWSLYMSACWVSERPVTCK